MKTRALTYQRYQRYNNIIYIHCATATIYKSGEKWQHREGDSSKRDPTRETRILRKGLFLSNSDQKANLTSSWNYWSSH